MPAQNVRAVPGRGVEGEVAGQRVRLGSTRWMAELGVDLSAQNQAADTHRLMGHTLAWLSADGVLVQLLAFGDKPRPQAAAAIQALAALGIRTLMITGDHPTAASTIARAIGLGLADVRADVLPADKVAVIRELAADGPVGMVGDGINDAPALAAATVGFAMGSGTAAAMHAAGITLMRSDPRLVADAIDLSRRTTRKIYQNLFWAFIYNLIGIPLAAAGMLNPVIAGAAMAASSVSVIGNTLLLRRWRPLHARPDAAADRVPHVPA
jgi:Cu+-exporting ATPase